MSVDRRHHDSGVSQGGVDGTFGVSPASVFKQFQLSWTRCYWKSGLSAMVFEKVSKGRFCYTSVSRISTLVTLWNKWLVERHFCTLSTQSIEDMLYISKPFSTKSGFTEWEVFENLRESMSKVICTWRWKLLWRNRPSSSITLELLCYVRVTLCYGYVMLCFHVTFCYRYLKTLCGGLCIKCHTLWQKTLRGNHLSTNLLFHYIRSVGKPTWGRHQKCHVLNLGKQLCGETFICFHC